MNEKSFFISEDVKWKEVNESIIIDPDYALNSTAAFVFKRITDGLSNLQIADALSMEFDADISVITADLEDLLQDMQAEKIIKEVTLRS
ncbi:PqqD family protein [Cronobacter dublinensis]|uniref:PqqD family protein n=1 Tax=Cronobacter dublinensis TaxID=413497 RepID=UPI000CFB25E7|nr:PqqD family protein [Cronobacter dublinensis]EKP4476231.1 PqqD family protein [Cronobacter dublinensis]EKY3224821.1 PqqD family protein [Cronobacter dublinensis]EMA8655653.1 PqqD family protein [Cronobacter dublinensis]MDT3604214.1 PqqD family protein [Cronobacter dublinensis]